MKKVGEYYENNCISWHRFNLCRENTKRSFFPRPNLEHWLGNGIYFYQDFSLAKWWTTNLTNKFGTFIKKPVILSCDINVDENKIINMLKLEDYLQFSEIFEREFYPLYKQRQPVKPQSWKKIRCTYCDFLQTNYELDLIIGNFNKPDQPYLPAKHNNEFDSFLLQYSEVQICIFDKNIISNIKIEEV